MLKSSIIHDKHPPICTPFLKKGFYSDIVSLESTASPCPENLVFPAYLCCHFHSDSSTTFLVFPPAFFVSKIINAFQHGAHYSQLQLGIVYIFFFLTFYALCKICSFPLECYSNTNLLLGSNAILYIFHLLNAVKTSIAHTLLLNLLHLFMEHWNQAFSG